MREQATKVHVPQGRELFAAFLHTRLLGGAQRAEKLQSSSVLFYIIMKHIYKLLLSMLLCIVPASQMYSKVKIDGLYYNLDETSKTAEVSRQSNVSGDLVIPSAVEYNDVSYQVTSIGYQAFYYCSGLTSITIPESVTNIGNGAFSGCSRLTSITIPESVTSIGDFAFYECSRLTSITIPESVTSIGNSAFYGCSGLTSVTIPESVTSIGDYAFEGCSNLFDVTINSEALISAERYFYTSLASVFGTQVKEYVLCNKVTSLGSYVFSGCSGLTSITIPESVTCIGNSAFSNCSGLTSITIPESVTSIGEYAFYECSGLTSITIPESVTSIGYAAFDKCSGLTSITIPESVTSIGNGAFSGCSGLESIMVASGNAVYDSRDNCNAIIHTESNSLISGCQNTIIPESVTSIVSGAFWGCSSLASITIPESVTSIGDQAFTGCSGLTSITIPESVTSIGYEAFYGCSGLTSITIPENVTSIGNMAFYGTPWYQNQPDGLICIGKVAYMYKGDMPQNTSITIPESVTSIGNYAFSGCSGLTSITIPEGVTSIGDYAFQVCSGLTSITIPESVISIGLDAFRKCSGLTSVTTYITNPFILFFDQFSGINSDATLYVPTGTTSLYEAARWTQFFAHVEEFVATDVTVETAQEATETERYDMQGRRISNPAKGINILRMSDGTTRKVMVK